MALPPHHPFIFPPHDYEDDHNNTNLFHGGGTVPFMMKRSVSFSGVEEVNMEDESSDDGSHNLGEKKRRLNLEQVRALEKSFELGNKLEPDRKLQLAKAIGLKPRQVAIWFQNRRARWKTKQLEKDYDVLKKQFEALKSDTDVLQAQNKELNAQLLTLKTKDSTKNEVDEGLWSSKSLFSASSMRPTSTVQLLQVPSRPDLPYTKLDQVVQEEGFCHMFNGSDHEKQEFWAWGEHQNFH